MDVNNTVSVTLTQREALLRKRELIIKTYDNRKHKLETDKKLITQKHLEASLNRKQTLSKASLEKENTIKRALERMQKAERDHGTLVEKTEILWGKQELEYTNGLHRYNSSKIYDLLVHVWVGVWKCMCALLTKTICQLFK